MIKILLILLFLIYFYSIIKYIVDIMKISSCINTIEAFLKSAKPSSNAFFIGDDCKKLLNDVLAKYPDICDYLSINSPSLGYGKPDYENYNNTLLIYDELFMTRNFFQKYLKNSFNPLCAVKNLIILPSTIINCMGFRTPASFSKIFNILALVATYFLSMYQDEIKAFINSLLKSL